MLALSSAELTILDWIALHCHTPWLDAVVPWITRLGDGGILWIILALVLLILPKERLVEEASHYIDSSRKQLEEDARRVILEPGQRVKHRVFGEGEILSADEKQKCYQIQFRGMDTPRSISFRVKMEIL